MEIMQVVFWKGSIILIYYRRMPDQESIKFSSTSKLDRLLSHKKILYKTEAIFPFQLAPDRIVIDTQKVTIFYNQILGPTTAETILIESILDLDIDVSFVFAALKIKSLSHDNQWLEVTHLPRS